MPLPRKSLAWKGHVDVLVNNAGGGTKCKSAHLFTRTAEEMETLVATNLLGTLFCCKAFGKIMADQGHGKIINIASIAGLVGRDRKVYERNGMLGQPIDYAAAKAGVIGMTRDLAGLLSPMGVHVNAISPGGFGPRDLPAGFVKDYSDLTPMGRMGRDGVDLKGAALFLASPASDYVTGQIWSWTGDSPCGDNSRKVRLNYLRGMDRMVGLLFLNQIHYGRTRQ